MKADMEALKEKMATIMEAMMSIKEKKHALRCPHRTCARARVLSEVEEVQEQIKADMEAMKEKMATMMEANISMKEIMEVNVAALLR